MSRRRRPVGPGLFLRLRLPLVALAAVVVYGIVGYVLFGHPVVEAVSRTLLVLTTVGFTPGEPGRGEQLFTSTIALFGVGVFLAILGVLGAALAEGRFGEVSRRRRMERRIGSMKDHFIICAYGRVGRTVAREFEAERIPFVVIDRLDELEERMRSDGVAYLVDDPTSEAALRRGGIERARGLVSAVDSDADSVYITLTARSLRSDLFIVARASEAAAADRLYRAGADRVISPYVSSGRHMALLALRPRVVDYLEIVGRDQRALRLEEVMIEQGSPMAGREVRAASGTATPLVIRRARGDLVPNPRDDEVLEVGDLLVLLGEPTELRTAEG